MDFFPRAFALEIGYVLIGVLWAISATIISIFYFYLYKKFRLIYCILCFIFIHGCVIYFTYPEFPGNPPSKLILNSINVFFSYDKLKFNDLFEEINTSDYEKMYDNRFKNIAATYKFRELLPIKTYIINFYNYNPNDSVKNFIKFDIQFYIYIKDNKYYSNDKLVNINSDNKDSIVFNRKIEKTGDVFYWAIDLLNTHKFIQYPSAPDIKHYYSVEDNNNIHSVIHSSCVAPYDNGFTYETFFYYIIKIFK